MNVDASPAALDMEEIRQELEQFRSTHRPRCRIPTGLWARAAELAQLPHYFGRDTVFSIT